MDVVFSAMDRVHFWIMILFLIWEQVFVYRESSPAIIVRICQPETFYSIFRGNVSCVKESDFCQRNHLLKLKWYILHDIFPQVTERLPWYHDDESLGSPCSPLHSPGIEHKDDTVESMLRTEVWRIYFSTECFSFPFYIFFLRSDSPFDLYPACHVAL